MHNNDPASVSKLLRAIAAGSDARASRHDVIFTAAAEIIDTASAALSSKAEEVAALESEIRERIKLADMNFARAEAAEAEVTQAKACCDSYALENQQFHDRFTAAEAMNKSLCDDFNTLLLDNSRFENKLAAAEAEVERLTKLHFDADDKRCHFQERAVAAEASVSRMKEALEPFIPFYEKWMDDHADDAQLHLYRNGRTFGDLRRARVALGELQSNQSEAEAAPETELDALRSEIERLHIGQAVIAKQVGFYKPDTPNFEFVKVPLGILRRALHCVPPPYPEDGFAPLTPAQRAP